MQSTHDGNQELAVLGHVGISFRLKRNNEITNSFPIYFKIFKEMLANTNNFWSGCNNLTRILFHFSLFYTTNQVPFFFNDYTNLTNDMKLA